MDEGILEVSEVAGDRVVELRGVGELPWRWAHNL